MFVSLQLLTQHFEGQFSNNCLCKSAGSFQAMLPFTNNTDFPHYRELSSPHSQSSPPWQEAPPPPSSSPTLRLPSLLEPPAGPCSPDSPLQTVPITTLYCSSFNSSAPLYIGVLPSTFYSSPLQQTAPFYTIQLSSKLNRSILRCRECRTTLQSKQICSVQLSSVMKNNYTAILQNIRLYSTPISFTALSKKMK